MRIPVEIPAPCGRARPSPLARLWGGVRCGLLLPTAFLFAAVSAPLPPATGSALPPAGAGHYEFRQEHSGDGIGKFYLGREIAQVMGHQAADWLERQERDAEEKTELLVASLPIKPGDVVADIGAGTGYFSRRLAKKVGAAGKILAVDIQPEMLELLTNKMAELKITNVVPILGAVTNPNLPAASVDLALMVDVYHEFDHPQEMMEAISKSLRPGGRVVLVEFRGEDPQVPIKPLHKMTEAQVRKEMSGLPLEWVETKEVLSRQHIIIFKKISG
jgi:ubiquinone/menaquinone biosynthesis C-methylase UbiE